MVGRRSPSSPCSACATCGARRPPRSTPAPASSRGSLAQLARTFAELRRYPQTLLFLLAYLFYNDGIQTVITSSSLYGAEQLRLSQSQLITTVLLVQFVAFGGALLFGRLARSLGAWRVVRDSLALWLLVVVLAFFVPAGRVPACSWRWRC